MRDIAVEIPKPCSADWDAMEPHARSRLCAQCRTRVHDLSSMTETEAESFLHDNADDEGLCVSYLEDDRGSIVFAQPKAASTIVPARSLLRRLPVTAGFAAAMAACTPAAEVCEEQAPAAAVDVVDTVVDTAVDTAVTEATETRETPEPEPTRSLLAHPEDAVPDVAPERAEDPDAPDEPCDGGFSEQPEAPTTKTPPPIRRTAGKPMIRKMGKRKAPTPRP